MGHDFPEWFRPRAGFPSDRVWSVNHSLPEAILERLAALEAAERRPSAQAETRPTRPGLRVVE
jgi:hypothetical protein